MERFAGLSVRSDPGKELTLASALLALAGLIASLVVRRRRRLAWLAWSTACLLGIVIMTGSVLFYYTTKA